jgi:hypothetical protein
MPSPETAALTDDAVLWSKAGHDATGEAKVSSPMQIECRWVWKKTQSTDATGNTVMLDATVVVDREIEDGSILWNGTLEEWEDVGSEETNPELMEVKTYKETKDMRGRETYRELGCAFYRGRLPTISS